MRLVAALMVVVGLSSCQKSGSVCRGEPSASEPPPDFACTPVLIGSMVCPRGQVGWGYTCTAGMCWQLFMDGPCVPAFEADSGAADAGHGSDGGLCPGAGGVVPPRFNPNGPCTSSITGAMICPAPWAGYGFECTSRGCWSSFSDGPCGPSTCFGGRCDAGDEGRFECHGGLRSTCSRGCWVDTGVCTADAGLLCGAALGLSPGAECTPALAGTTVCPAGPSGGYGYTCTSRGCWDGFFDGPCASLDAGVRDGN